MNFQSVISSFLIVFLFFACERGQQNHKNKTKKHSSLEPVQIILPKQKKKKSVSVNFIDEKEPNDYPAWAQFLPPEIGVKGYINKPWKQDGNRPDRDVFLFEVPAPGRKILWAKLSAVPDIDLFLAVHKKNGDKILSQDVNTEGKGEIIVNLTLKPGRYFFKLGEHWKTNDHRYDLKHSYTLEWKLKIPNPGDEIEPNDRRSLANQVDTGRILTGYLSSGKDYDNFLIPDNNKGIFRIDYTPPQKVKSIIWLWKNKAKKPSLIYEVNANEFVIRRIKLAPVFKYLTIHSKKSQYSLTSKYKLKLSYEADVENYETEPNDNEHFAEPLSLKHPNVYGFISNTYDTDVYEIKVSSDTKADIILSPPENLNLKLGIKHYHPGKPKKNDILWITPGKNSEKIALYRQFLKSGTTYLFIEGVKHDFDAEQPYSLFLKLKAAVDGDEIEPNNSFRKHNVIKPGIPAHGIIYPIKDKDVFSFTVSGSLKNPPVVEIKLTGGESINPVIILKDSWNNIVMEDVKGVYSGIRKIRTPIHPYLRYYIIVKDKTDSNSNISNPYELKLDIMR